MTDTAAAARATLRPGRAAAGTWGHEIFDADRNPIDRHPHRTSLNQGECLPF
jgi:hypothetical protein